jgi:hypothetical protein
MFKPEDGSAPKGVIQGADTNLYGTTYSGGPAARSVVFCVTLKREYHLLDYFGGNVSNPTAGLVEVLQRGYVAGGPDPPQTYLYGAVAMGSSEPIRGPIGYLYRLRPDGTDYSVVYNFDVTTGAVPQATPVLARDSTPYGSNPHAPDSHGPNLFGITAGGGSSSAGVFYRLKIKYLVSGFVEANPTTLFENLVFQGSAEVKTWINSNDTFLQVATYITTFPPTFIARQHKDGITVRAKDPKAKFVQFFIANDSGKATWPISRAGKITQLLIHSGRENAIKQQPIKRATWFIQMTAEYFGNGYPALTIIGINRHPPLPRVGVRLLRFQATV